MRAGGEVWQSHRVHPIERLRYVARANGGDHRLLVRETANAIADLDLDPAGIVVTCRRIVQRHPTSGPLWWLCANILAGSDPSHESWRLADFIEHDPTPNLLVNELPDEVTVCVVGWPDLAGEALIRRGDVTALVIDSGDDGARLVRRLRQVEVAVELIPAAGIGAAVTVSDLVLVEADAAGPDGAICAIGSLSAAAVAYCSEVPVWLVAGRGRRLPPGLWQAMGDRLLGEDAAWDSDVEVVPLGVVAKVFGPEGLGAPDAAALAQECPMTHELLRLSAM